MCTRVSRTPDKERGTKGREIRGNRSRDTSTGTPGLWGWPSPGSLDPQERPEIELSAIRRGFDLGYRVGGKFEGERDCPLIIYPRDEVENSDRTRSGILPGRRKQPSSRARSSAERRRCLKSSPLLLWMVLPTVCVWKNYYLRHPLRMHPRSCGRRNWWNQPRENRTLFISPHFRSPLIRAS